MTGLHRGIRGATVLGMTTRGVTVSGLALSTVAVTVASTLGSPGPVGAEPPGGGDRQPANPWRYDHWPQTQPWQRVAGRRRPPARSGPQRRQAGLPGADRPAELGEPRPHDLGRLQEARRAPTGPTRRQGLASAPSRARSCCSTTRTSRSWSPSRRAPRSSATRAPRPTTCRATRSPKFYQDFLNTPERAQPRPHHPRVLDGGLRRPLRRRPDRRSAPYQMPGKSHEYGMEFQGGTACPAGDTCDQDIRTDGRAAWVADDRRGGRRRSSTSSSILSAGQDESSTWQEFGHDEVPDQGGRAPTTFGPPDPSLPNWSDDPLRRVDLVAGRLRRSGRTPAAARLDAGRELRHGRLRPRAQPHPRHRRQLQQPVRRPAAARVHRHLGDAQPRAASTAPAARTAAG